MSNSAQRLQPLRSFTSVKDFLLIPQTLFHITKLIDLVGLTSPKCLCILIIVKINCNQSLSIHGASNTKRKTHSASYSLSEDFNLGVIADSNVSFNARCRNVAGIRSFHLREYQDFNPVLYGFQILSFTLMNYAMIFTVNCLFIYLDPDKTLFINTSQSAFL